jgi:hypothetical protein
VKLYISLMKRLPVSFMLQRKIEHTHYKVVEVTANMPSFNAINLTYGQIKRNDF